MAIRQTFPENRQLDLLGGGIASTEVHRLFFALLPDDATRARMMAVAEGLRAARPALRARWIHPSRYHATLHFLGDHAALRPMLVETASAAAATVRFDAFHCVLDTFDSFRGREPPCVLRGEQAAAAAQSLWQALGHALTRAGVPGGRERSFVPHVTLAYSQGATVPPSPLEPLIWRVRGFSLVHSVVGQGGHQVLASWPADDG